jgi:dTDP-4-dehydrorhamnose reductase
MRILLLGKFGQLGWELKRTLPFLGDVIALDRDDIDLSRLDSFRDFLGGLRWDVLVNASAYTAVDQAEAEMEIAGRINTDAPRIMAELARNRGAVFVHYSTDYVFDGRKNNPYVESDSPHPINAYGQTKFDGERAVQEIGGDYFIFRTSWVYSMRSDNFVTKVIKWLKQGKAIQVVTDQTGCPTWSRALAEMTSQALFKMLIMGKDWITEHRGIYHLAGADYASRFELACRVADGLALPVVVTPSLTEEFPSNIRRPAFSALSSSLFSKTFNIRVPVWSEMLDLALETLS